MEGSERERELEGNDEKMPDMREERIAGEYWRQGMRMGGIRERRVKMESNFLTGGNESKRCGTEETELCTREYCSIV